MTQLPTLTAFAAAVPDKLTMSKDVFANSVYVYLEYFNTSFTPEMIAHRTAMNTLSGEVQAASDSSGASALTSATEAGISTTQAGLANIARIAAEAAVAVLPAGTIDDLLISADKTWSSTKINTSKQDTLVSTTNIKTVNGASILGAGDLAVGGIDSIISSSRTADTILGVADKGVMVDITSGTFTQTFTAAATLADGWWCYIRNSGTGDITLDPSTTETIDGLASFIMYPSEVRLIMCNGISLSSIVLTSFFKTFIASSTFVKPPGYAQFGGFIFGGGGSGWSGAGGAGGGGGGSCVEFNYSSTVLSSSVTVTIAAGGLGVSLGGNTGGTSTFHTVSGFGGGTGSGGAGGGGGGTLGSASGANPGAPTKGYVTDAASNVTGGLGGFGGGSGLLYSTTHASKDSIYGGAGGAGGAGYIETGSNSVYGGGGGGYSDNTPISTAGGTSIFGGAGGAGVANGTGIAGTAPSGGGGGGSSGAYKGGAGARGELRIWGVL